MINETIKGINNLMEAFVCIAIQTNEEFRRQYSDVLAKTKNKSSNKGFSSAVSANSAEFSNIIKQLGWEGFNEDLLKSFSFVLNYGYKDQFEARTYLSTSVGEDYLFSALLKRNHLREEEGLIVNKYSRFSEKDFIIFGMVTQSKSGQPDLPIKKDSGSNDMKEALAQMTLNLSEVEKQFTGKLSNEIIIDPIAIYREF